MEIRIFELKDLNDVIEMSKRAYEWGDEGEKKAAQLLLLKKDLLKYFETEKEGMFVAVDNGRIVGTCFAFMDTKDQGHLDWVGIDTDSQRKGIGTKLLKKAVDYLEDKGIRKIVLSTDRPLAMPFYLKHGFRIEGWRMGKELDRKTTSENEIEKLLSAAGEYCKFHFRDENSEIMRNIIKKIIESEKDSVENMILMLRNMIKEYWAFIFNEAEIALQMLEHDCKAIRDKEIGITGEKQ